MMISSIFLTSKERGICMPVVKTYQCPSCGASLSDIRSASGTCSYCGSAYVIEGMKDYQDITQREGIKSGVAFRVDPDTLHNYIIDFLTANPCAPLEILSGAEITEEQCVCIPSYYYHYNGTSDYMCDVGNDNQRYIQGSDGKNQVVTETQWSTISGNTRAEIERIVCGNHEYDAIVDQMYFPYQGGILTDVESLELPPNATVLKYTRPASELLEKYVRPEMKTALEKSAVNQMGGRKIRNLTLGNSNIEKDETIDKVLVGLYRIILRYGGESYNLYVSGNGQKVLHVSDPPVDPARVQKIASLQEKLASVNKSVSGMKIGIVAGIVLGIILLSTIIVPILCAAGVGWCIYNMPKLKAQKEALQKEIDAFNQEIPALKQAFKNAGSQLNGAAKHLYCH